MKAIIKEILLENQHTELPHVIKRRLHIPLDAALIISLVGARRSGKTYLLYDLMNTLLKNGLERKKILFVNFEDERLALTTAGLDLIVQAYSELYPEIDLNDVYLFFDEIQNVKGWEKFVRRLYDTKTRHIFITGSNSRLLSTEIASELRGRTIAYTVYPLSFSEYLDFKGVSKNLYPQRNKSAIIHHAEKFLVQGGFPETVGLEHPLRVKLLQQYFNVMIFRDIVERYEISNIEALRFFIKKLFAGVTKTFSVNKAYNDLRSMGYKISNKYLYDYLTWCNDAFLCQSIGRFSFSEIKQAKSDKKPYIVDTGLLSAVEFSVSENKGKLLENMVFLEFLKSEKDLFYFKGLHECDFIVKDGRSLFPVQVAWSMNDASTRERELKGLTEACNHLGIDGGMIVCFDQEEEIQYEGKSVQVYPFYKYFLETLR
ncbi:MAG TPA: ATP-binding protein [Saprospiraceae bacterium]|nr:ATP-binding protein [Saprospiraceae bacterium]